MQQIAASQNVGLGKALEVSGGVLSATGKGEEQETSQTRRQEVDSGEMGAATDMHMCAHGVLNLAYQLGRHTSYPHGVHIRDAKVKPKVGQLAG